MRRLTIPCLELMASFMDIRIGSLIRAELEFPVDCKTFWTFWGHIPGTLNPADDRSHGLSIDAFQPGCRQWYGLDFLWHTEDWRPMREVGTIEDDDNEVIHPRVNQNTTLAVTNSFCLSKLLKKFSLWPKLVYSASWPKCFVHYMESKCTICGIANTISLSELYAALRIIIKIVHPTAVFPRRARSTEDWAAREEQQIKLTLLDPNWW